MITEIEQETSDFDWFFTNGINVGCVSSGGGRLPLTISRSWENFEFMADFFRDLPPNSDFIINPQLKEIRRNLKITDRYFSSFIYLAERGIFTYDKTILNNFEDTNYHLVTAPVQPIMLNELPRNISDIILKTETTDLHKIHIRSMIF
ncbi:hypothetical protein HQ865_21100 [Mucilaginibacter mali]|uniref:Uncharacterized protein n=1 Tax=Mucilaginibacter mali TaxID=2740462 RepID=A0A7D4TRK2_9SPHI|nr:hypothetical protein [Mucilaginibacter mali]QKJ32154.1 hypothetical protein HQ865_21100 [Mucilaginibacter mali]